MKRLFSLIIEYPCYWIKLLFKENFNQYKIVERASLCFLVFCTLVILGAFYFFNSWKFDEPPAELFSRFGSIITSIAVIGEFILSRILSGIRNNIDNIRNPFNQHCSGQYYNFNHIITKLNKSALEINIMIVDYRKIEITSQLCIHTSLLIGTVVWGYGDLLFKCWN